MKDQIRQLIQSVIEKLYPEQKDLVFSVDYAPSNIDADFASNAAMILAKKMGKKPMEVAEEIKSDLSAPITGHLPSPGEKGVGVTVAVPGFLNFKLPAEALLGNLREIIQKGEEYGLTPTKSKEKILMEYFQPNIAKPLHVGHMRSAIIGDSLFRIQKFLGAAVESDTHMGDWGTQFGLLLYAYKQWGDEAVVARDPINELNKLYIRINAEAEKNPELHEAGKTEFVKLEQGDKENRELWQKFVDLSMERFLKINELLDISRFDHHWPESFYEDKMPEVLQRLQNAGLIKESDGAQIVDLTPAKLGTAIIVKSDGGTTYLLRDLATFIYRKRDKGFQRQIYVVDNRQSHHFRQLFKILEMLGEWQEGEGAHVDFGFMSLPEGAMSTRKGNVIELEQLVAKAIEKAKAIIAEKNSDLKNAGAVARDVAIGALKYFDLSHNRHSDIVFTWDKALAFEGNTGPYLQYTHARLRSILRKAGENSPRPFLPKRGDGGEFQEEELAVLRQLMRFGDAVSSAASEMMPSVLASYQYELADLVNSFYHAVPVLQEKDEAARAFRLNLVAASAIVLKNGLGLLGIEAPEEM